MGRRITKAAEGRPVDWTGFDGLNYHGRIVAVTRGRFVAIDYHVPGRSGEYRAVLDAKKDRDRIVEIY
jgi:hypothetical protein